MDCVTHLKREDANATRWPTIRFGMLRSQEGKLLLYQRQEGNPGWQATTPEELVEMGWTAD